MAEVTTTCGAGCTYLGATGTEIQTAYFETLYDEIACCNLYDQVPFYEFGRSFWFWGEQLALQSPCTDPITTGFAVWMRFRSMRAAQVKGAPFDGVSFDTFRSQVQGLEGIYDATTSDTFAGTLCADQSPGMYSGTDFWASIMMKLASLYGGQQFTSRFWQHLLSLPAATSVPGAITNWLNEAGYASCVNLGSVFYKRRGFPQPNGTVVNPRPVASTVPFPLDIVEPAATSGRSAYSGGAASGRMRRRFRLEIARNACGSLTALAELSPKLGTSRLTVGAAHSNPRVSFFGENDTFAEQREAAVSIPSPGSLVQRVTQFPLP